MEYDHFAYGEALASSLKDISHSPQKKRFFTAFGLEDLTDLNDSLSSVDGNILIAVDGCESDSEDNGADALNDKQVYSFIVAQSTVSGNPNSINRLNSEELAHWLEDYTLGDLWKQNIMKGGQSGVRVQ